MGPGGDGAVRVTRRAGPDQRHGVAAAPSGAMVVVGWVTDGDDGLDADRGGQVWVSRDGQSWVSAMVPDDVGELTDVVATGWRTSGRRRHGNGRR